MVKVLRGVVHGRTIELETEPGIEDGRTVEVIVRSRSLPGPPPGWHPGSTETAAGMMAEHWTEEDDRILAEIERAAPPAFDAGDARVCVRLDTNILSGVLSMMFRSGLRRMLGVAAALGVITLGIGMLAHRPAAARSQDASAASAGKKDGRAAELIVWAVRLSKGDGGEPFTGLAAVDPVTGRWRPIHKGGAVRPGRVSPDGRFLVYSSLGER